MRSTLIGNALVALVLISMMIFCGPVSALDFDFSGTLQSHNDVRLFTFTFTTTSAGIVTLFSSSWDDGGFDPMLGLWNSAGQLIVFQDDGHNIGSTISNGISYDHGNWDSYFSAPLAAGTYTVSLTAFDNFHLGNLLTDGFELDKQAPIPITSWNQPLNGLRTGDFVFHALNTDSLTPVPLPGSVVLLGLGIFSLAAFQVSVAAFHRKKLA